LLRNRKTIPAKLTPEQYQSVAPYLLEKLVMIIFWHRSTFTGKTPGRIKENAPQKKPTAVVHDKFIVSRCGDAKANPDRALTTAFTNAICAS